MTEEKQEDAPTEKPKSALDETKEILAQIQQEKAELKEQADRLEAIKSEQMLSGQSAAGQPPEKKEETPAEYKDRIMQGEGRDDGEKDGN